MDDLLPLEQSCESCGGTGKQSYTADRCVTCNGAGYVPTAFGEHVLALMRHNFRPMLDNCLSERED